MGILPEFTVCSPVIAVTVIMDGVGGTMDTGAIVNGVAADMGVMATETTVCDVVERVKTTEMRDAARRVTGTLIVRAVDA